MHIKNHKLNPLFETQTKVLEMKSPLLSSNKNIERISVGASKKQRITGLEQLNSGAIRNEDLPEIRHTQLRMVTLKPEKQTHQLVKQEENMRTIQQSKSIECFYDQIQKLRRQNTNKTNAYLLFMKMRQQQAFIDQKAEEKNKQQIEIQYQLASEYNQIKTSNYQFERGMEKKLCDNQRRIQQLRRQLNSCIFETQGLYQQNKTKQIDERETIKRFRETNTDFQEHLKTYEQSQISFKKLAQESKRFKDALDEEIFFISILKLQLAPTLRIGFVLNQNGLNKKGCLNREKSLWDKRAYRPREIDVRDITYFVIIQLYNNWRKILKRLSFRSQQYKMIFGLERFQNKRMEPILEMGRKIRQSTKNWRKVIALGAPIHKQYYEETKVELIKQLQNFDNGILKIQDLSVQDKNGHEELELTYTLFEQVNQKKTFQLHRITQFTRQEVRKYIGRDDLISCVAVNIPTYNTKSEEEKYQSLYDFLKTFR